MNFDTEALLAEQLLDWTANCPTKMWAVWARVNVAWLSEDVRTIDSGLLCERSVRSMYPPCGNIACAVGGLASLYFESLVSSFILDRVVIILTGIFHDFIRNIIEGWQH
jgi:hypothetical protein